MKKAFVLMSSTAFALIATSAYAQEGGISPAAPPPGEQRAAPLSPPGDQQGSNASEAAGGLEEIIVTAQKREQNLQNVPVAVTAITADTLVNRNVSTISDIPRLAPSLTITQGNVPTNNSINLRGIGTVAFSTGIEPSVAVIVDDVPLLQQAQAFSGLSDIARIEVLRGPQGTLFGKNASAGALNIVSQGPSATWTGAITGTATTDEEYRVDGSISGPLSEGIGFRLNGFYGDREGFIRNLFDGRKFNNDKSYGLRGRLTIAPTEGLTVDLIAAHSVSESDGTARTYRSVPAGAAVFGTPVAPTIVGITPGVGNFATSINGPLFNRSKQSTVSGRAIVDLGAANLISVTSYQDWRFRFIEDFDYISANVLGIPGGIVALSGFHARMFTQELRISSKSTEPFSYTIGAFYGDGKTDRMFDRGPSGPVVARWNSTSGTKSYAAFGQASYAIAEGTHVDGGVRLNHEDIRVRFLNTVPSAAPPANNATCLAVCAGSAGDTAVTGKIALRQDLTDRVMAYASFSTGYKGQGFDVSSGFAPRRVANPVRPETSHAYELGLKSRLFDNRVQFNVALFHTRFKDFQAQSGQQLPDQTILVFLNNVGRVRTQGVEVEFSAKPTQALRLDGAFSYTDAKILEYLNAPCFTGQTLAQGCYDIDGSGPGTATGQNLSGRHMANSPRVKFNIGATYDVELPSLPFNAFLQADVSYQSLVNFDLNQNPLLKQGAYTIVNASVGLEGKEGRGFRLALFVNNLFNVHYASALGVASGGTTDLIAQTYSRGARRYGGARLRYSF